jgi:hypothetical protein
MRTVQADSCFNSEQIDTLFISVGGQEGGWGGGSFWAGGPKSAHDCQKNFLAASWLLDIKFIQLERRLNFKT